MKTLTRISGTFFALLFLFAASFVQAQEASTPNPYADVPVNWETLESGIQHAYVDHAGQQIHMLKIDVRQEGLSFFVSPIQGKTQTSKDFLEEHKLAAAINANFFDLEQTGRVIGLAVSDGNVVSTGDSFPSFLILKDGRMEIRPVPDQANADLSQIQQAVSGDMILVQDGQPLNDLSGHHGGNHPRTAIGFSQDQSTVFFFVVDGRQKQSIGLPVWDVALWMVRIGAYQALNLDGGGSTTLVVRNADGSANVLNHSFVKGLRPVGNSIGVRILPKQAE